MSGVYLIADSRSLRVNYQRKKREPAKLVITSPPYHNLKEYSADAREIGRHQRYGDFLQDVCKVLKGCYEVSTDDATMWLVVDTIRKKNEVIPLPFDIISQYNTQYPKAKWHLRDVLVWHKEKNMPWHQKGRMKREFEYILFCTKSTAFLYDIESVREVRQYKNWWLSYPERYNPEGQPPGNVWSFSIPIRGWGRGWQQHLCPFPFPLVERIISLCSREGDVVLDPFAGSGTVIALASAMKRNGIGFDINKEFKSSFHKSVVPGAKKYWKRRSKELELSRIQRREFSENNQLLRKLKFAVSLQSDQRVGKSLRASIVVISNSSRSRKLRLVVFKESPWDAEAKRQLKKTASEYSPLFKVDPSFNFTSRIPRAKRLAPSSVRYVYTKEQIFKFSQELNLGDFLNNGHGNMQIISNIKLSLADGLSR